MASVSDPLKKCLPTFPGGRGGPCASDGRTGSRDQTKQAGLLRPPPPTAGLIQLTDLTGAGQLDWCLCLDPRLCTRDLTRLPVPCHRSVPASPLNRPPSSTSRCMLSDLSRFLQCVQSATQGYLPSLIHPLRPFPVPPPSSHRSRRSQRCMPLPRRAPLQLVRRPSSSPLVSPCHRAF